MSFSLFFNKCSQDKPEKLQEYIDSLSQQELSEYLERDGFSALRVAAIAGVPSSFELLWQHASSDQKKSFLDSIDAHFVNQCLLKNRDAVINFLMNNAEREDGDKLRLYQLRYS